MELTDRKNIFGQLTRFLNDQAYKIYKIENQFLGSYSANQAKFSNLKISKKSNGLY